MCWAYRNSDFGFRVNPMIFDPIAGEVEGVKAIDIDHCQTYQPVVGNLACRHDKVPHRAHARRAPVHRNHALPDQISPRKGGAFLDLNQFVWTYAA